MKKFLLIPILLLTTSIVKSQCSDLGISVSFSDTSQVQLYHAGFFLLPSGFDNVCEWQVTTFSGDIVFQDTTQGDAFEQGLVLFEHSIPIADSMKVIVFIKNSIEGTTCTLSDTLFWEETEVLPGIFIGNWAILNGNTGTEGVLTSAEECMINDTFNQNAIALHPTLVNNYIHVSGPEEPYSLSIMNVKGQIIVAQQNLNGRTQMDVAQLLPGIYFVHFSNQANEHIGVRMIVKQ